VSIQSGTIFVSYARVMFNQQQEEEKVKFAIHKSAQDFQMKYCHLLSANVCTNQTESDEEFFSLNVNSNSITFLLIRISFIKILCVPFLA